MALGSAFVINHWSATFHVSPPGGGTWASAPHESSSALFFLRHAFSNHHQAVVEPIERWFRASGSSSAFSAIVSPFSARSAAPASPSVASWERSRMQAWDAFERAVTSGALQLTRVEHDLDIVSGVAPSEAQLLESGGEPESTYFDATVVDEVNEPITGLELVLTCEGQRYDLVTNGAGQVRLDGVTASRASLHIKDRQQLSDIVAPRWRTPRSGASPRAKNLLTAELGESIDSFALVAKEEHLIVITPVLEELLVEWWDGRSKNRHIACPYQVSGPRSFSGKTDEYGQLRPADVPLGEYTVTLTVTYFTGRSYSQTRTFKKRVTVSKGCGRKVCKVGPAPEVAFRRTRGAVFDANKSFLMPAAARELLATLNWWSGRAPSHLLIVGHAEATNEQALDDLLSNDRAAVVKAFFEQDAESWLSHYDKDHASQWGQREDGLMLRSLPDYSARRKEQTHAEPRYGQPQAAPSSAKAGETIVEWFQRTRGLTVDDVAGPQTRRALIAEYMSIGSVALRETPGYPVSIATLGEGGDYPLAKTGLPLDLAATSAPNDDTASGTTGAPDCRLELFFFDTDFGILPPIGSVGGPEYTEWRTRAAEEQDIVVAPERRQLEFLELPDVLFRTDSCVVLPHGDAPTTSNARAPPRANVPCQAARAPLPRRSASATSIRTIVCSLVGTPTP